MTDIVQETAQIDSINGPTKSKGLSKHFNKRSNRIFSFIILCVCCFFENLIITGSATVVLSTIEKEFFLTSTESGLFLGIFELAAFISSPLFGFFGSLKQVKKLKLISLSLLLLTVGSYLIGLLIFVKQPYLDFLTNQNDTQENQNLNLCYPIQVSNESVSKNLFKFETEDNLGCDSLTRNIIDSMRQIKRRDSSLNYVIFLYIGHFIIGLGSVAIYTVGIAYIEEIALPNQSSFWQAILFGTGSIGGGIGFLVTGQFLNLNARFYSNSYEPNNWIKPENTYWIGAWWFPYLIYGSICGILFVLVLTFSYQSFDKKYLSDSKDETEQPTITIKSYMINFIKNIIDALKNLKLIFVTLAMVTEGIILKGFLGFMSKYIEYQFEMKASDATLALGSVALVSVICGTLISAKIIEKYKLGTRECSLMSLVLFFSTSFCFLILLNYCPEMKFVNDLQDFKCVECNCQNRFNPVCISKNSSVYNKFNMNTFQSACHAGCSKYFDNNHFGNCDCVKTNSNEDQTLSVDLCQKGLKCLTKFLINGVAAFLIVLFTAMSVIPHLKSLLGCVDEIHQSLALGVRSAFVGIMGNFAGTIVVGQSVDLTCKYWQRNCFDQKVCKVYDNYSMSFALAIIGFGCRFLSGIFMIYPTWKFYQETRLKNSKKVAESQFELLNVKI